MNTNSFSTATTVSRTRLKVTFMRKLPALFSLCSFLWSVVMRCKYTVVKISSKSTHFV